LDPEVIKVVKTYMPEVPSGAFEDKRVEVIHGDGRRYVEGAEEKFDVVISDVTDPGGPSRYLYTLEFYKAVRSTLNKPGLMVTHAESPFFHLKEFLTIYSTLLEVFEVVRPYKAWIPSFGAPWGFMLASTSDQLDPLLLGVDQLKTVLSRRGVLEALKYYGPQVHLELFSIPKFLLRELEEAKREKIVATDQKPIHMEV